MKMKSFHPPRIEKSKERLLLGFRTRMNINQDTTRELWGRFVKASQAIVGKSGPEWYSVEIYPDSYFDGYDPDRTFEKWAAVAVEKSALPQPSGMEELHILEGLYAVFRYEGPASQVHQLYRYIFADWIPGSGFALDPRPHFALMGAGYKGEDPNSREELWIPIRKE
jgi:AraC family transcriptional regulator